MNLNGFHNLEFLKTTCESLAQLKPQYLLMWPSMSLRCQLQICVLDLTDRNMSLLQMSFD